MERIHVGICDDVPEAIEQIHKMIAPYLENRKICRRYMGVL